MSNLQAEQTNAVLQGIVSLLDKGRVVPGERLPSERRLSELLGVSRANVRLALQKLEFYGIVKIFPQSGSVLADHSPSVIRNQIQDIVEIDCFDFHSLVTVRVLLESEAIRLCCAMRTDDDLRMLDNALQVFKDNMHSDLRDEKDFAFHMAIAKASHNPVIESLLLSITPDVLRFYRKYKVCAMLPEAIYEEHRDMLECIRRSDADGADKCLRRHFKSIEEFSRGVKYDIPRAGI